MTVLLNQEIKAGGKERVWVLVSLRREWKSGRKAIRKGGVGYRATRQDVAEEMTGN